jgi:hypothetical protein
MIRSAALLHTFKMLSYQFCKGCKYFSRWIGCMLGRGVELLAIPGIRVDRPEETGGQNLSPRVCYGS